MNENRKKFLDRLYDDMLINNLISEVDKPKDRDSKIRIVNDYLDRLSSIENDVINYKSSLKLLKKFYYQKYIIKEEDIPDNYYLLQSKINSERGLGLLELNDSKKKEIARGVILVQKKSLDKWLEYFISSEGDYYSYELKYWAFQGLLTMGKYDKNKQKFMRRSNHTVAPFLEFNKELIALTIGDMQKYLNNEKIDDDILARIIKNNSFVNLYTYHYNKNMNNLIYKDNDGIWIKYDRYGDYKKLANSLEGMNTGWCTASEDTAKCQLDDGDFYVYYTKDESDNYKIPRLAIRMKNNKIEEIRGVNANQNVESNMELILEDKLREFPDKDKYYKKINDMKLMTKIYNKQNNNQELNKDELIFLYEIVNRIDCFGEDRDPRIEEVKNKRNIINDFMFIFNIREDEITKSYEELINNHNRIKCFIGNLELVNESVNFPNLFCVYGNAYFHGIKTAKNISNIKYIIGNADFSNLESAVNLNNLEYVIGDAIFDSLDNAKGLNNLKYIGRDAGFDKLHYFNSLDNLSIIEGDAEFKNLIELNNSKLRFIGGDAFFDNILDKKELDKININGNIYIYKDYYSERMR